MTVVAKPAIASSIELSTTSHTRWCRPRMSVDPMYMPGASTDGLQALEDLDAGGGVVGPRGLRLAGGGGAAVRCRGPLPIADVRHAVPPMRRS